MALRFKIAKRKLYLGKRKGQTVYYAIQEEHPHTSWMKSKDVSPAVLASPVLTSEQPSSPYTTSSV